jgi:hypothetical protein
MSNAWIILFQTLTFRTSQFVETTYLVEEKVHWYALLNTVMKFQVPYKTKKVLTK